jgi:hypothetical protein
MKQFVAKASRSPMSFLAVCFALWLAAHSFFAALFVGFMVYKWVKASIREAVASEAETSDAKQLPAAPFQPKAEPGPAAAVTPIKRQYAKSPVVVPLKTGTDD